MADDEQFSLCWNNFNSNLSAGFHESLCRGDLVDVTLAAEGQFVKAHRLVLSVCSPYFRKMFTQMPANQHAFVFLKDVSHTALKDLIQFMYCGEVNVKQEALPAFISTAEALQIKGLTDSDPPPSQSPAEPSTPSPQIQQISSPRVRQRTSTSRSFKIESVEDSGDDKQTQIVIQTTAAPAAQQVVAQPQTQHLQTQSQTHIAPQQIATTTTATTTTVVTHKRPARSIGSGPHIKRTKSTIDPLDTTDVSTGTQQITVQTAVAAPAPETKTQVQQQQSEPEYIDLPIELPTKSEPDYAEDAGDVDGGENETTYVEDDSYGELRYDESYFTENDDTPAGATTVQTGTGSGGGGVNATTSKALVKQQQSSFTDTSYVDVADQGNSDAQDKNIHTNNNNQNKKLSNKLAEAKIPLHAGSRVYVSKHDLAKIFIPNACIYTSRLSELVFGLDVLENIARSNAKQRLLMLDENLLKSIIITKPMTLPKLLDGKFYKDVQPNRKTFGGIQATCTTCLGVISGTTKSTGNFLSHIKRRHREILSACQMYCQTKAPHMSTVISDAYNNMCDSIKVDAGIKEVRKDSFGVPMYTEAGLSPPVQFHGQHNTPPPAFLWHKALPVLTPSSMAATASMQYRKLKPNMQPNGCYINSPP